MACTFTLQHLAEIFDQLKLAGYQPLTFEQAATSKIKKGILLRHDLDQDLEKAVQIAELEQEKGLTATYFVWLNSPFYNPLTPENTARLRYILSLGHHLGLHIEVPLDNEQYFYTQIEKEAFILESYLATPCPVISFHRPSANHMQLNLFLGKRINAYAPLFTHYFQYLSDSRGTWKENCVCQVINKQKPPRLHLLLHPLWWDKETLTPKQRINAYVQTSLEKLQKNCQVHIEGLENN